MIKVFISQPMKGKSEEEIKLVRGILERIAQKKLNNEAEIIDSYFEDYPCAKDHKNIALKFLAKSIDKLADADVLIAYDDYRVNTRGCFIEYECAQRYDIIIIRIDPERLIEYATEEERRALLKFEQYFHNKFVAEKEGHYRE